MHMSMQVDVECAELFVEDLHTFLCRHGAVTSNDSHPLTLRDTIDACVHVLPVLQYCALTHEALGGGT